MLKILSSVLTLIFSFSFVSCLIKRLPVYVGAGYDLARGNPKENEIDSGFRQQIFELKYDERVSTEDGRFLVPDDMITRDLEYCSYQPTTKEYTGVNSYQADLKSIASPSRFSQSLIVAGSFSANPTYKAMQKATKNGDSIFIETSSKCETYSLQLQSTRPALSRLFESDVIEAFTNLKSWETVFNKYGTHYVTYAIYGAHVISTYKFKRASYQMLRSKNFNFKAVAEMKFTKKVNEYDLKTFYSNLEHFHEAFIGPKPLNPYDLEVWRNSVANNPKPIQYRLASILELIEQINFAGFNSQRIRSEFSDAVYDYGKKLNCSQPLPDAPSVLKIIEHKSKSYGSTRGTYFEDTLSNNNANFTVTKVILRASNYLYTIQFQLSDGTRTIERGKQPAKSSKQIEWPVPRDQYINEIELQISKNGICIIKFTTNQSIKSTLFGKSCDGKYEKIKLEGQLAGLYGTESDKINSIGFLSYVAV